MSQCGPRGSLAACIARSVFNYLSAPRFRVCRFKVAYTSESSKKKNLERATSLIISMKCTSVVIDLVNGGGKQTSGQDR